MKQLTLLSFLIFPHFATADVQSDCKSIKSCVDNVSKYTGDKYLYSPRSFNRRDTDKDGNEIGEVKNRFHVGASENLELNKENADRIFSELLSINGYAKIKVSEGTYKIIPSRDIRYNPVPIFQSKYGKHPGLPNNQDYVMVVHKLKHHGLSSEVSRGLRPFVSRYGRIIDNKLANTLTIQDTNRNVSRLLQIIDQMDVKGKRRGKGRKGKKAEKHKVMKVDKKI